MELITGATYSRICGGLLRFKRILLYRVGTVCVGGVAGGSDTCDQCQLLKSDIVEETDG